MADPLALPRAPRPLAPADLAAIDRLVPEGWNPFGPIFEHYFATEVCTPWGLDDAEGLAAMGTLIRFASSGWIAQLVTHPRAQGRGLATRLLSHLGALAEARGLKTLSLMATEAGYPLYLKAGFRVEEVYGFWVRGEKTREEREGSPPGPRPQPAGTADLEAFWALDAEATGEDRRPYGSRLLNGLQIVREEGRLTGAWAPAWGEGLILARTEAAGLALLTQRLRQAARTVVPEGGPAARWLEAQGWTKAETARRMVKGPALDRRSDLVWSRVAGNLG